MNKQERVEKTKAELVDSLNNPFLAVVGRVESWLKEPDNRYPVSCTVLSVKDSMEGEDAIEQSWLYVSKALRFGAGVALNLSELREKGNDNGKGLVASGATSFLEIYSSLNSVLRRGGTYKNGAVVAYIDSSSPELAEFLKPSSATAWVKKALYVDDNPESPDYLLNHPFLEDILYAVRAGTIWLAKKRWDKEGNRLYSQACLEILLKSKATCLLAHLNLGKCKPSDLRKAFKQGMTFICKMHSITGAGKDNYYLSPKEDKQVGLGVLGLANFLANNNISYKEFTVTLKSYLNYHLDGIADFAPRNDKVYKIVDQLYLAFQDAAKIARKYKMDRAFTVAPTATCSFRYRDLNGFTTTPEISPPICHPTTKKTVRNSSTFGQQEYQYPLNVETAEEVGWDVYYELANQWQRLMDSTGLGHSISFNVWNTCPVDREWIESWLKSNLVTTYYRMQVEQNFVDKTSVDITSEQFVNDKFISEDSISEEPVTDFLAELLSGKINVPTFLELEDKELSANLEHELEVEVSASACSIGLDDDGNFCSSCSE